MVIEGMATLTVVNGSRARVSTQENRDLAAGDIQMQFVADPGFLVALAVLLGADIARGGQIGEHLIEVLRGLPFEARRLGFWPFLVLARASALARRLSAIGRLRTLLFVVRRRLTGFSAPRSRWRRARDTPTMRHPSSASISAASVSRHLARKIALRKLRETVRQRQLLIRICQRRSQPRMRRSDLSTSRRSIRAVVVGRPSTALATKALARARRSPRRAAGASGRFGNEGLKADHVEGRDEPPERLGYRLDFLTKPGRTVPWNVPFSGLS